MKKYKIVFTAESVMEIKETVSWYNKQQKGLGQKFKSRLKEELNSIKSNPFAHSVRYDKIRFAFLLFFPMLPIIQ